MRAPATVFRHYLPGPQLRPYVCGYMWFTLESEEPERTVHRFHADGRSETRFNSADPLLNHTLPGAISPRSTARGGACAATEKTVHAVSASRQQSCHLARRLILHLASFPEIFAPSGIILCRILPGSIE